MKRYLIYSKMTFLTSSYKSLSRENWAPPVDLYRTPWGWVVKVELAGVQAKDIQLQATSHELKISGHRWNGPFPQEYECYIMEIPYDKFERTLTFSQDLDKYHISSEYDHGMLWITLDSRKEQSA